MDPSEPNDRDRVAVKFQARGAFAWSFLALAPLAGCLVSASRYDHAVTGANLAREDSLRARQQIRVLRAELATIRATLQTKETTVADLDAASHNLQTRLEEATAIHEELQKELSRLGENVGTLVKDKESLQRALDDAKARLITLQALQAAAEARDAAIKSLAQKLTPLVETKRIEMATHDGQTVLVIPGSVLFESDRTEIKRSGEVVLEALAHVLSTSRDWRFRIAAYSPAQVGAGRHHAVFGLSAARASHVADRLVDFGLAPSALSVAGYVEASSAAASQPANGEAGDRIEIELTTTPAPMSAGSAQPAVPAGTTAPGAGPPQ
ncbi:MAG: OmpA family protein [Polyangia bacterium]